MCLIFFAQEQRLAKQQMMMVAEPVDLVTREEMSSISNLAMARMGVFAVELKKFFYANYNRLQRFSDTKNGRGPLLLDDLKTFEALFTHLHTKVPR